MMTRGIRLVMPSMRLVEALGTGVYMKDKLPMTLVTGLPKGNADYLANSLREIGFSVEVAPCVVGVPMLMTPYVLNRYDRFSLGLPGTVSYRRVKDRSLLGEEDTVGALSEGEGDTVGALSEVEDSKGQILPD